VGHKGTVFRIRLAVADIDRHHYQDYALTLARHPSETDDRMMLRLLAFALHADEALKFTAGLCVGDEPEIWSHNLDGSVANWIEIGQPDTKHLRKAGNLAEQVFVYSYNGQALDNWWQQNQSALAMIDNLTVVRISVPPDQPLSLLAQHGNGLQCTIEEENVLLSDGDLSLNLERTFLMNATGRRP